MEFGRLSESQLATWWPGQKFSPQKESQDFPVKYQWQLGLPIMASGHLVGKVYPPKTSAAHYWKHYTELFSCFEVNSTFYSPIKEKAIEKWLRQLTTPFAFWVKASKLMTHEFKHDRATIHFHMNHYLNFLPHLGGVFFQFPPHFTSDSKRWFFDFVERLRSWRRFPVPFAFELRHESWFQETSQYSWEKLREYLEQEGDGLVALDTLGRPDLLHILPASGKLLVRFLHQPLPKIDQLSLRRHFWLEQIKRLPEATQISFIFHDTFQNYDLQTIKNLWPELTREQSTQSLSTNDQLLIV